MSTTNSPSSQRVPVSQGLGNVLFSLECTRSSPMVSTPPQAATSLKYNVDAVVQSLRHVWVLWSWTASCRAALSFTVSQSLLKLKSIESMMPSNHLILCRPLLLPSIFPSIRVFSISQFFASCGQIIAASASASVLPINTLKVDFL